MITIRLSRTGKRKQPYYRMVVQDSKRDPWSPAIEIVGNIDPRADRKEAIINKERIEYWLGVGAQPSGTVRNLLIDLGVMKDKKKKNNVTITEKRAKSLEDKKVKSAEKEAAKKEAAAKKEEEERAAAEEAKKADEAAKAAEAEKVVEEKVDVVEEVAETPEVAADSAPATAEASVE